MQYKSYMWWSMCILSVSALSGASEATIESLQNELGQAIRMGNESRVRELLRQGAHANGEEVGRFNTPLIEAVRAGRGSTLDLLVAHGADIEKVDTDGKTALVYAVDARNLPMIQRLLDLGADTEVEAGHFRLTPVVTAAMRGDERIVKLLARYGARWPTDGEIERIPASFMIPNVKLLLNKPDIKQVFRERNAAEVQLLQKQEETHSVPRDVTRVIGEFSGISPQGLEGCLPAEHGSVQPE